MSEDVVRLVERTREAGFPPSEVARVLRLIVKLGVGRLPLALIRELVVDLPVSDLDVLVGQILQPFSDSTLELNEYDWVRKGDDFVIARLTELGLGVVDSAEGFVIKLRDGTRLTEPYRNLGQIDLTGSLPDRGLAIARLGITAFVMDQALGRAGKGAPNEESGADDE